MDEETSDKIQECRMMIKEIGEQMDNIMRQNKKLKKENTRLKEQNDKLMKMAMKFPDAIALQEVSHRTYFAIIEALKMDDESDEEKLEYMKKYLRPSIEENPRIVLSCIDSIKEDYKKYSPILDVFHDWIINTFAY